MNKITIQATLCNGIWTATIFVGQTIHCQARRHDCSDAIKTAVSIFRLA